MRLAPLVLLALPLCPVASLACTVISASTITTNTTWGVGVPGGDSCYIVQSTLTIGAGATLTIQAGTRVKFPTDVRLVIGGASTAGSLIATGTPTAPIIFEALNGSPNGWGGLDFAANSDLGGATSSLTQCIIRHGGGAGGFQVRVTDSNGLTMTDCQVTQHSGIGLVLSGSLAAVSGCVFDGSEASTYPASGGWRSVSTLFADNRFVAKPSGARNAIELRSTDLGASLTMSVPDSGFCYLMRANDDLVADDPVAPVLTLLPGTMLKVDVACTIMIGFEGAGGLIAEGVVFTSAKDDTLGDSKGDGPTVGAPGDWNALRIEASATDAQTLLRRCTIRFSGANMGAGLYISGADPTVEDCLIDRNNAIGLSVVGNGLGTSIRRNLLRDNTTYEVGGPVWALPQLVPQNDIRPSIDGKYNAYLVRSSDMASSRTLPVPAPGFCYVMATNEDIVIDNAAAPVLTLLPGTVMKFHVGCTFMVGLEGAGGLIAEEVVFTSSNDDTLGDSNGNGVTVGAPGDWNALRIEAGAIDAQTLLRRCTIRFSGANMGAGLYISGADPTVEDCLIDRNNAIGLSVVGNGLGTSIRRNLLRNNTTYEVGGPVWALPQLVPQNDIRPSIDGKYNAYLVRASDMATSRTLPVPAPCFCYVMAVNEDIVIDNAGAPVLTLLPGTVLKVNSGCTIMVGSAGPGGLNADGVVFTSAKDDTCGDTMGDGVTSGAPGDWNALRIEASATDALVVLRNCTIRFGGANFSTGLRIDAADPTVEDCLIERNNGAGIRITGAVSGAGIRRNLLRDNTTYEIAAPLNAIPTLVASNDIRLSKDGRYNAYDINGGSILGSQTLPLPPLEMVYLFTADVAVPSGASLTIPAPVVLKFNSGTRLTVGGTLTTQGRVRAAPYAPVVFTSYRDDGWWGDTNGDGRTAPVAGDWERVELGAGSNLSVIRGAVFSHGGGASQGQLFVNNTGAQTSPAVQIHDCHFDVDLATGGIRTTGSYALVDSCSFRGTPANVGLSNTSTLVTVDAPRCWWGAPSGPYDPSATDPCTNPGGAGVGVSNYVNYCPWLTDDAPVTSTPEPGADITTSAMIAMGPVPTRGAMHFTIDLANGDAVEIQVFDISGRAVRRLDLPGGGARRATLGWDGRDAEGRTLRPGVYLLRIRAGAIRSTHRVVVVP